VRTGRNLAVAVMAWRFTMSILANRGKLILAIIRAARAATTSPLKPDIQIP
jgi:hypothetical protein